MDQLYFIGFMGLFWFVVCRGWQMNKAGRIDDAGRSYLYWLTGIVSLVSLVWFLKALKLNVAGEFLIGSVAVAYVLSYVVRLLRFFGWGSVQRGVLVVAVIGLI